MSDFEADDDLDDLFKGISKPYIPEYHSQSPIRDSSRKEFMRYFSYCTSLVESEKAKAKSVDKRLRDTNHPLVEALLDGSVCAMMGWKEPPTLTTGSEALYGEILSGSLWASELTWREKYLKSFQLDADCANRTLKANISMATGWLVDSADTNSLVQKITSFVPSTDLIKLAENRARWESYRTAMAEFNPSYARPFITSPLGKKRAPLFWATRDLMLVPHGTSVYIFDYQQVMMLTDTITSRHLTVLACELYYKAGLTHLPRSTIMHGIYAWGDRVLTERKNDAYSLIKKYEPIAMASFLDRWEDLEVCRSFWAQLLNAADSDEDRQEMTLLFEVFRKCETPNQLGELFRCFRQFGHPTVNEAEGAETQQKRTREPAPVHEEKQRLVMGAFCRNFVRQWIKVHGAWPKCHLDTSRQVSKNFQNLVARRLMMWPEYEQRIPLSDWAAITFEDLFTFDDFIDFTELLNDKAISPDRHHFFEVYSRDQIREVLDYHKSATPQNRRLLFEVLTRPKVSFKDIRLLIQNGLIKTAWLIVGLCAKERELKEKARLFSILVMEMRMYFSVTEKNLALKVLKYVEGQTMTISEAELTKRMYAVTAPKEDARTVRVIMSLDFDKFNQSWSRESTEPFFRMFDSMFATPNLYSYTHRFFEQAFFYLSSRLNPPAYLRRDVGNVALEDAIAMKDIFQDSETTWQGQKGGLEGLRQKGWTIIIMGALYAVEYEQGISSSILGQGDNQVLVMNFPVPSYLECNAEQYVRDHPDHLCAAIRRYQAHLKDMCEGLGMTLKLDETWVSQNLMNYGKELIHKGHALTQELHKLSRNFPESNDSYPMIDTQIASVFSSAHTAAGKSVTPVLPYYIAVMECHRVLRVAMDASAGEESVRKLVQSEGADPNENTLFLMTLMPTDFGGYPVMPFTDFMYRGHPDPLTSHLVWLKEVAAEDPTAKRILGWVASLEGMKEEITTEDQLRLIQDPLCLNFSNPVSYTSYVRNLLESRVREVVKNEELQKVFQKNPSNTRAAMVNYLWKVEPCFPRVLGELFRNSVEGYVMSILAKFSDMKTIKGLLSSKQTHELVNTLGSANTKKLIAVSKLCHRINQNEFYGALTIQAGKVNCADFVFNTWRCTTVLAQYLREKSWNRAIEGSTTPHPLEQFRHHAGGSSDCVEHGTFQPEYITYSVLPLPEGAGTGGFSGRASLCFHRGPYTPYSGSSTTEKLSQGMLAFSKVERGVSAGQRLVRILDWICDKASTLCPFVHELVGTRTDIPIEILEFAVGKNYGGCLTHRFRDATLRHDARPNFRPNMSTSVRMSSDNMGQYSRGADNYTMHFQGAFLATHAILTTIEAFPDLSKVISKQVFHQHVKCLSCCKKIEDRPLMSTEPIPPLLRADGCALVHSSISDLESRLVWDGAAKDVYVKPFEIGTIPSHARKFAAQAVATILVSLQTGSLDATSQGVLSIPDPIRHDPSLTVGVIMKLGVTALLGGLARLWLAENVRYLAREIVEQKEDPMVVISASLMSTRLSLWSVIIPQLLVPEIRDELILSMGRPPGNIDATWNGAGLGKFLARKMVMIIKDMVVRKDLQIPILCSGPGFTPIRLLKLWFISMILSHYWGNWGLIYKECGVVRNKLVGLAEQGTLKMSQFMLFYEETRKELTRLPPFLISGIKISSVGAELWTQPGAIPERVITPRYTQMKTVDHAVRVIRSLKEISYPIEVELGPPRLSVVTHELPEWGGIAETIPEGPHPERDDHKYRLLGIYSTGMYKVLHITAKEGLEGISCSMHMAEGGAGMAAAVHLTHGTKDCIFNTKLDIERSVSQRYAGYLPAELVRFKKSLTVHGNVLCAEYGGDLCDEEYFSKLKKLVPTCPPVELVTMDAEWPGTFPAPVAFSLACRMGEICSILPEDTLMIFKTFCKTPEIAARQVCILSHTVREMRIVVPFGSSHESREVYIVGRTKGPLSPISHAERTRSSHLDLEKVTERFREVRAERKHSLPFQSRSREQWLTATVNMEQLGFQSNLHSSFAKLVGQQETIELTRSNLKECAKSAVANTRSGFRLALKATSALYQGKQTSIIQREQLQKHMALNTQLNQQLEWWVNAQLVVDVLEKGETEYQKFLSASHYSVHTNDLQVFTYKVDPEEWCSRYARSMNHLIGHLEFRLKWWPKNRILV
ncbi:RNA dependent RNA polymerase [Frankliniella occidentalis associated mononegavirales virus 1]|uniref:RNA-directed RNA polymerase L n=1 Tax=Frankliniella occidentalis associated mononegavirales virus 1 TaxID=2767249 RepID=A0A7G9IRA3_9MONO|nr:RNA dependent RNA polymerase [Frankliniella occidentalis associated mononegavirales virus 1]